MAGRVVGSVAELWRFPVKSMGGERLDQAELTARGFLGDRVHAILDLETGKVISASSVKLFPDLLDCHATFLEPPRAGGALPPVRIAFPDGAAVTSDAADVDARLSAWFKREVKLARTTPDDIPVGQTPGSVAFTIEGLASALPEGSFFDLAPLSVLTTSTLARLRELAPDSAFDARRFRMNVIVATSEPGFLENDWVGQELALGATARLIVALPDPRCVMTTLAQGDLPKDPDILRTLARHNMIPVGESGQYPCAGVYAVLGTPGVVRTGDSVKLG
jgi:uncharacterized protein YcbX